MEAIELIQTLFKMLGIDWTVVLLYIGAGFLTKAFLPEIIRIPFTKLNITQAWRVLVVGSLVVAVYVLIEYKYPEEFTRATLKRLFVSYIFTTSMYEIVLRDTVGDIIIGALEKLKPKKSEN